MSDLTKLKEFQRRFLRELATGSSAEGSWLADNIRDLNRGLIGGIRSGLDRKATSFLKQAAPEFMRILDAPVEKKISLLTKSKKHDTSALGLIDNALNYCDELADEGHPRARVYREALYVDKARHLLLQRPCDDRSEQIETLRKVDETQWKDQEFTDEGAVILARFKTTVRDLIVSGGGYSFEEAQEFGTPQVLAFLRIPHSDRVEHHFLTSPRQLAVRLAFS